MTIHVNIELVDKKQNVIYTDSSHMIKETTKKELIREAKRILYEEHGITAKRTQPVYIDVLEGSIQNGFIISFWDKYDDNNKRFNGEAWVTFSETIPLNLDHIIIGE